MTWTDEELVARSRTGDMDSFNQLILRWERPIYALAYRVIGQEEDARDVAQETFLPPGFTGLRLTSAGIGSGGNGGRQSLRSPTTSISQSSLPNRGPRSR